MVKLLLLVCIIASMATAVAGASAKPTSLRFKSQVNTATGGCLSEGKAQADGKCQCETKRDEWKASDAANYRASAATTVNFCKCCHEHKATIKWVKNSCKEVAEISECGFEAEAGFPTEEAKKKLHNACHAERHAPECAYPKCAYDAEGWMHDREKIGTWGEKVKPFTTDPAKKAACKVCAIRLEKCCDGGKKLEKYDEFGTIKRSEASTKSLWRSSWRHKVFIHGEMQYASPNCKESDKVEYLSLDKAL